MNASMQRGTAAILAAWLAASACSFLSGAPRVPTVSPQDIAYTAAALALTAQAAANPAPRVETPAPLPTEAPAQIPLEDRWQWFPSTDSHCRAGPGIQYESLTMLWSGQRLAALGTDSTGSWVQVRMPLSTNTCWTLSETGNVSGSFSELPVISIVKPVPTATLPKPAASGADIDVLRLGVSSAEAWGVLYMDIRNNGPEDFQGRVKVVCLGRSQLRDTPYTQASIAREDNIDLLIAHGMAGTINTSLELDTSSYLYPSLQCAIAVPHDPNSDNNIGKTSTQ